jgi:hypothetical protein
MSLHLYIYALGNPINNSDPIGLSPLLEEVGTVSIRAELEGLIRGSQQQFLARQIMARIGWRIELAVFKVFAIAVAIGVQTSVDLFKDIAKRKTGAANVFFPGLDTLKTTDHIRDAIASGHSVILHRKKPPHSRSWIYNTGGCRLNWASVTGLECDEYPFANSEEGGRLGSPTPSTRLVPDWEQNRQGGLLSSFFDACDIKPNDSLRGGFAVVPTYLPFTTWTCRR